LRTRVKICGITRVEDAASAVEHGCDAIGLVFYEPSPRYVTPSMASEIASQLPPFVTAVGLFVDASPKFVQEVLAQVPLNLLQFHGDETPEYCRQFGVPYLKAVRVRPETNLLQYAAAYADAKALLLDTYLAGTPGGTGITFDWTLIPQDFPLPIILAGGLDAGNVNEAVKQCRPYAVDVSGGVEHQKGIKDADKIAAFMRGVLNG
jgi:phosphoribosylanthranilate isomerase